MADSVGATPDELIAAGRPDAAAHLRDADTARDMRRRIAAIPGLGDIGHWRPPAAEGGELLPLIATSLDAITSSGLPASAVKELTSFYIQNLIHDAARRHDELLLMLRLAAGSARHTTRPG